MEFFTGCIIRSPPGTEFDVSDCARVSREMCISPQAIVMALVYTRRLVALRSPLLSAVSPFELYVLGTVSEIFELRMIRIDVKFSSFAYIVTVLNSVFLHNGSVHLWVDVNSFQWLCCIRMN